MSSDAHEFHPSVLREYDIRGIVGQTLFPGDARALGRVFGTTVRRAGGRRVVVGRDGRLSSPELHRVLLGGLREAGCEALDIGLGATPMLYFAVHHLGADGGVQVTGSHNPPSHNGFKMMLGKASFFGADIRQMGVMAAAGDVETGAGSIEPVDLFDAYVARLARDYHGTRAMKVAWDAGNGSGGPAMRALSAKLPGQHILLFAEVDGHFPNHHPDPTIPANLQDLIATVRREGCEIGIAFDGDADRIGVVDGRGRIIWGDQILQILATDILEKAPGATIIADVKASQTLFDEIGRMGGKPLMWKTGHSLIKAKMVEVAAPLSGEMSGHIFYKDNFYGHDDALYVAVRLLDILGRGDRTLADYRDAMPEVLNTPEVRFDCPEERKFEAVAEVKRNLERETADLVDVDGVRVRTEDGWWLLRASNTQAALITRAEATTGPGLERLKAEVRRQLGRVGLSLPHGFEAAPHH